MKERPIPFNVEMAPRVLDGTKTLTRRVMKPQPGQITPAGRPLFFQHGDTGRRISPKCPYGQPGDRLWVREPWKTEKAVDHLPPRDLRSGAAIYYLADGDPAECAGRYRHARFMPRLFSRITLEIVGVRVERLQDISEEDAKSEGSYCLISDNTTAADRALLDLPLYENGSPYRNGFALLWESINGPGSWDANPWVWVVEFRRVGQ